MRLYCVGYNRGESQNFCLTRPPRRKEYVMLVLRSRTFFEQDGVIEHAPFGTVWIYDKSTPHHFGADGEPFLHDWITFDLTTEERERLLGGGVRLDSLMRVQDISVLSHLIWCVQHEKYGGGPDAREIAEHYLYILLLKLAEQVRAQGRGASLHGAELGRIRAEIYADPKTRRTAGELAERLHVSVSYFQHLYKAQFGTTPTADMIAGRIEYAKDLLVSTDYTVKMIADALDYASDILFIKQFTAVCGVTPKNYRRRAGI